jgi:hypothetical protein
VATCGQPSKEEIDNLMAANRFQSPEALTFKETLCGTVSGFRFPLLDWSMASRLRKLFNDVEKFSDWGVFRRTVLDDEFGRPSYGAGHKTGHKKKLPEGSFFLIHGGKGEIRTHGTA